MSISVLMKMIIATIAMILREGETVQRERHTDRHRLKDRQKKTDKQNDRLKASQPDIQTKSHTDKQPDKKTNRRKNRQTKGQTKKTLTTAAPSARTSSQPTGRWHLLHGRQPRGVSGAAAVHAHARGLHPGGPLCILLVRVPCRNSLHVFLRQRDSRSQGRVRGFGRSLVEGCERVWWRKKEGKWI